MVLKNLIILIKFQLSNILLLLGPLRTSALDELILKMSHKYYWGLKSLCPSLRDNASLFWGGQTRPRIEGVVCLMYHSAVIKETCSLPFTFLERNTFKFRKKKKNVSRGQMRRSIFLSGAVGRRRGGVGVGGALKGGCKDWSRCRQFDGPTFLKYAPLGFDGVKMMNGWSFLLASTHFHWQYVEPDFCPREWK